MVSAIYFSVLSIIFIKVRINVKWEQRKGKSIFYSKSNKDFPELTVLSATQDKGMIPRSSTGIDIKYEKKSLRGYKKIEPGDFVVHLRSFQGGFAYSDLTGIVSPAYTVFTFKQPEMFNNYFWKEKFTSYNFIQLLKKVTYGVRDGRSISYSDFLTLNEKFPVKVEQTKIADLFKIIDNLITLQQRKLEQFKQLKKALLQQLFVDKNNKQPNLRFKNFNGDWEQHKLDEMLQERNEQITVNDKYPLMSFVQGAGVVPKSQRYNREFLVKSSNKKYKKTELGDFIYSSNNLETGSIGFNKTGKAVISSVYSIFKSRNNRESQFIGILSKQKKFINKMLRYRQGVVYGQWKIHESDFLNLRILAPNIQEQEKIIDLFSKIDTLITLQQNKLTQLTTLKKYLLQKLFI